MTDAPHGARFSFEYGSEREARIVERSVGREVGEIDDDRSRTTVERDGRRVVIDVETADPVTLRAATNTWISLVGVAERTLAIAGSDRP